MYISVYNLNGLNAQQRLENNHNDHFVKRYAVKSDLNIGDFLLNSPKYEDAMFRFVC